MFNIIKYSSIVFVTFCIGFFVGLMAIPLPTEPVQPVEATPLQDELWSVVNEWRKSQGYAEYSLSPALCGYAEIRAKEIQSDWSHNGFIKLEKEIFTVVRYTKLGENLVKEGFPVAENYLYFWLQSPTHKKNLEDDFTHSCIRCENNYCVQLFAK